MRLIDMGDNYLSIIPPWIGEMTNLLVLRLTSSEFQGYIPQQICQLSCLRVLDLANNSLSGSIPNCLKNISAMALQDFNIDTFFPAYWNLYVSYVENLELVPKGKEMEYKENLELVRLIDLSSRIPSSTQLQSFDALRYIGNPQLCGDPLPKSCTIEEQSLNRSPIGSVEDDSKNSSFYIGMRVGFATGFWAICGALFFNRTWRHAYFRFADEIKDWIYVTTMIKTNLVEKLKVCLSK
ncbi:receptor-like protein eix2 [Quercus suber]|uniref:Receptor-like protein eix2 n=2 Tax=Quercus suber TaxID=58331 RepID=A0AAW0LGE9_QUESU